jgi:hypothetical protein
MPSYTRKGGLLFSETRGQVVDGALRRTTKIRPALYAERASEEAFIGINTTSDPNRKLVYGAIDDRGRVRSHYFTDERGRLKIPYGSMQEHANYNAAANSITLTTEDQYYGWTTASDHETYGAPYIEFEDNGTADRLVIGQEGAGIWFVSFSFAVHSGGAAIELSIGVFVNGSEHDHLLTHRYLSGTNDMGAGAVTGFEPLEAGDYLDVRASARNADSKSIELHHMNLSLFRVNHKR